MHVTGKLFWPGRATALPFEGALRCAYRRDINTLAQHSDRAPQKDADVVEMNATGNAAQELCAALAVVEIATRMPTRGTSRKEDVKESEHTEGETCLALPVASIRQVLRSRKPTRADLKLEALLPSAAASSWFLLATPAATPSASDKTPTRSMEEQRGEDTTATSCGSRPAAVKAEAPPEENGLPMREGEAYPITLMLSFDSLPQREVFLEQLSACVMTTASEQGPSTAVVKREREGKHGSSSGLTVKGEPSRDDSGIVGEQKQQHKQHEERRAREQMTSSSPASLGVALSRFFSSHSATEGEGHAHHQQQQQQRGVWEATSQALESILLERGTWELRPLTEGMEADLLRQVPGLARLYLRYVRPLDPANGATPGPHGQQVRDSGRGGGTAGDVGSQEVGTGDTHADVGPPQPAHRGGNESRRYTREAFWTAVARQYLCLAHTFLEEEQDEPHQTLPAQGVVTSEDPNAITTAAEDRQGPLAAALSAASWAALPKLEDGETVGRGSQRKLGTRSLGEGDDRYLLDHVSATSTWDDTIAAQTLELRHDEQQNQLAHPQGEQMQGATGSQSGRHRRTIKDGFASSRKRPRLT